MEGSPLDLGGFMQVGAYLADIDRDGRIEIIQPVAGTGMIECLEIVGPGSSLESLVWPTQQHDNCRTSFYDWFPAAHGVPEPRLDIDAGDGTGWDPLSLRVHAGQGGFGATILLWSGLAGSLDLSLISPTGRRLAMLATDLPVSPGARTIYLSTIGAPTSGIYFVHGTLRTEKGIRSASSRLAWVR
jgi:hypothetical protein